MKQTKRALAVLLALALLLCSVPFAFAEPVDGADDEKCTDPRGHDWVLGDTVLETCTTDGYTPWICTRCGKETPTDLVGALGHNWDGGKVTLAPTCSTYGIMTYTCTREGCGETMTKELGKDPNGHVFKVTVYAPTCVDEGYTSHACTLCRYGYSDTIVPALGHNYAVVSNSATCTSGGIERKQCTRCSDETLRAVTALGHVDKDGDGKCDRCKTAFDSTTGEEIDVQQQSFGARVSAFFKDIAQSIRDFFNKLFGGSKKET